MWSRSRWALYSGDDRCTGVLYKFLVWWLYPNINEPIGTRVNPEICQKDIVWSQWGDLRSEPSLSAQTHRCSPVNSRNTWVVSKIKNNQGWKLMFSPVTSCITRAWYYTVKPENLSHLLPLQEVTSETAWGQLFWHGALNSSPEQPCVSRQKLSSELKTAAVWCFTECAGPGPKKPRPVCPAIPK